LPGALFVLVAVIARSLSDEAIQNLSTVTTGLLRFARNDDDGIGLSVVITGHSRSKNGVASARLCPVIHVLLFDDIDVDGRVKPGQAR
jgi:hypothetical protein